MVSQIKPAFEEILSRWREYIKSRKRSLILSIVFLIIILIILPSFLQMIELREGVTFSDPVLMLFNPIDVTWITFGAIYISLLAAIIHYINKPRLMHLAVLTYSILAGLRMIAMFLLPLNPPETIILLNDPFVQLFGSGEILTKDLFFSGHTSTLFMVFLITEKRILKTLFLLLSAVVAFCVVLQHVHYSIDVFAAPFFSFAAFKIAYKLIK